MPVPLIKPPSKTSAQVDQFFLYEVELAGDAVTQFEPRPPVAYSVDDAILKLAMVLKEGGMNAVDFLEHFKDQPFVIAQTRVHTMDGKVFPEVRLKHNTTDETIRRRLADFYPGAQLPGSAEAQPVLEVVDDSPRMISMTNSGSSVAPASSGMIKKGAAPKERRLITVQGGGGGESKQEALQAAIAMLTPENMPKGGMVLVMGKNGPRMLKTASARTDEEMGEEMADAEENGVEVQTSSRRAEEVHIAAPVEKAAPAPRPQAKAARVLSEAQLEGMAKSSAASAPSHAILNAEGHETSMDAGTAASLIDAEMGGDGGGDEIEINGPVLPVDDGERMTSTLSQGSSQGGRAMKKPTMAKPNRGGTRPGKV